MQQFLFTVEIPPVSENAVGLTEDPEWTKFSNAASTILKPVKACIRHPKNVVLLPAENAWPVLMALSTTADKHNLPYTILLIDGEITELTQKVKLPMKINPDLLTRIR
jgi:hypothetical protein